MATVRPSAAERNGFHFPKTAKPRKARKPASKTVSRARQVITVTLGCGIPCLSLALSSIGGRLLAEGHSVLGVAALLLCATVLSVSLSHLAAAIGDITRSQLWQSWCLAGAIDLSLVLGELAGVSGFQCCIVAIVMVSVTLVSALLNCWAFMRHCS